MRIFLDANILFSAARASPANAGAVRQLVDELLAGGHECVTSDYALLEARRNLEAQSEREALELLDALSQRLILVGTPSTGSGSPAFSRLPEKDRPILAAAISSRSESLLTGDRRHFGPFFGRRLAGVRVHSPASLAKLLFGER